MSDDQAISGTGDKQDWQRPVLIGGCGSSGTTLLSVMLDAHPEIACGPELALLCHPFIWEDKAPEWRERLVRYLDLGWQSRLLTEWKLERGLCPAVEIVYDNTLSWYGTDRAGLRDVVERSDSIASVLRGLFSPLLEKYRKKIWAEKTPNNVFSFAAFLSRFPQGRVVYLVRDGRDVVCSLMRRGFRFKTAVSMWLLQTGVAESFSDHPRAFRLCYEDLVKQPRATLAALVGFLQVRPEVDAMLDYLNRSDRVREDPSLIYADSWRASPLQSLSSSSIARWTETLSAAHTTAFQSSTIVSEIAGYPQLRGMNCAALLGKLGYTRTNEKPVDVDQLFSLLAEECLFLSGEDYDTIDTKIFYERLVACDIDQLPELPISWHTLQKVERQVMPSLLGKCRHLEDEVKRQRSDNCDLQQQLANMQGVKAGLRETHRGMLRLIKRTR